MSACILAHGPTVRGGYVMFGRGEERRAHRRAYVAAFGAIPDGHHVHHTCKVPNCINPEHLAAVTPSEHARLERHWESLNHVSRRRTAITHCPKGHPYDEENTAKRGWSRQCRECNRLRNREYHRQNRERINARRKANHLKKLLPENYLERGRSVRVLIRWNGRGPRNVLIEREDESRVVRPFRGLRRAA